MQGHMSTRSRGTIAEARKFVGWKSRRCGLLVYDANERWDDGELEYTIAKQR